jgi:hypothetical protein
VCCLQAIDRACEWLYCSDEGGIKRIEICSGTVSTWAGKEGCLVAFSEAEALCHGYHFATWHTLTVTTLVSSLPSPWQSLLGVAAVGVVNCYPAAAKLQQKCVACCVLAAGYSTGLQDGPGLSAKFSGPRGICMDYKGNLWVADRGNSCIRCAWRTPQ